MTADNFRALMAPFTAFVIICGGGVFLFLTLDVQGAEETRLIVSGLMGAAAQFLFGDAVQRRAQEGQPTITATAGPPAEVTASPGTEGAH